MRFARLLSIAPCAALLAACATPPPSGPSVMVLPGRNASFERFQGDDAMCRGWASQQIGITPAQAAGETAATGAVAGAAIGAAAGAAIGATTGNAGNAAAIGAGSGLLLGSAYGGSEAMWARSETQLRYDSAYMQCMYAQGHQIPVPRGSGAYSSAPAPTPYYDTTPRRSNVPRPPAGEPPPPPPDLQ